MPKPQRKPMGGRGDRKFKKRVSPLASAENSYIDYKDVDLLNKFISDRSKIRTRNVTGNTIQQQKEVARAVKNAREMGLIAYTSRVTTQRRGRRDRDDRRPSRGDRDDRKNKTNESDVPAAVDTDVTDAPTSEAPVQETPVVASPAPAQEVPAVPEAEAKAPEAPAEEATPPTPEEAAE